MSQLQTTADPGWDFTDRQLVMGPTETVVRVDLRGFIRAPAAWTELRSGSYQAIPPVAGAGVLEIRAPNPADQGGPGAQQVRVSGWRKVQGLVRPWSEVVTLTQAVNVASDGWLWVVGATARCGALKAVAGDVDCCVVPPGALDGCVRIEAGQTAANGPSVLVPPDYVVYVDDIGVVSDPPGAPLIGARLLVETYDDLGGSIDVPAMVPQGTNTRISGNVLGVAPTYRPWIRLQAFGAAGVDVHAWAKLTCIRPLDKGAPPYRSWLGPTEQP